jgi:hypothetical protein
VAKFAATDFTVTVNGTSLSTSLTSVDLTISADDKDVSTFGVTYRQHVGGLKQGQLKLNFLQDFAAGAGAAVESTLYPLLGTIATVVITPTSGTVSATNPSYTVPCLVTQVQPLSASVGDVATQQVTWMSSGTITKATS